LVKFLGAFLEDTFKTTSYIISEVESGMLAAKTYGFEEEDNEVVAGLEEYAREKRQTMQELRTRVDKCLRFLDNVAYTYKSQGSLFTEDSISRKMAGIHEDESKANIIKEDLPVEMVGKVGRLIALYDRENNQTNLCELKMPNKNAEPNQEPFRVVSSI
jgi:hypothetical protein